MITSNEPVIYRNVITEEERIQLKDYALNLLYNKKMKVNPAAKDNFRNAAIFFSVEELDDIHKKIFQRVIQILNLKEYFLDPLYPIIISIIKPGGYIHNHTDPYAQNGFIEFSNKRNVRFNIFIERGDHQSYNPVINNISYSLKKCDAWCFAASELKHKTEKISGPENRIVYQFGFMMDAI